MIKNILLLLFLTTLVEAKICKFTQKDTPEVLFKGFKTDYKVTVGSYFNDIKYTPARNEAPSLSELFVGSTVIINTEDFGSEEQPFVYKLKEFFFKKLVQKEIKGKILSVNHKNNFFQRGTMIIELDFNGVKKDIESLYYIKKGKLYIKFQIYINEFNGGEALDSLSEACSAEHLGKTWNDAMASFIIGVEQICY